MHVLPKPQPVHTKKKQTSEIEVSCHHVPNEDGKFYFCFNGGSLDDMLKGILIDLDTSMNPSQCQEYLQNLLKGKINMTDKQLIVYLSGGVPFIGGTINDLYSNEDLKFDKVIYGIITKKISHEIINKKCNELCNISDSVHQFLVSPLCNSSIRGLSDMACLLGYINHQFARAENLLLAISKVITFAPFITSIKRIMDGCQVVGRDVICVTSTFFTFFRSLIPPTTKDEHIYEYALYLCNIICKIEKIPKSLPLMMTEVGNKKFLSDLNLGPIAYIWLGDSDQEFNRYILRLKGLDAIRNIFGNSDSLKPVAPLSTLYRSECSIVKGRDHEFLYLEKSSLNGDINKINYMNIIDPMTGLTESIDVSLFAKQQGLLNKIDEVIDPSDIRQIISINLDSSNYMNCNFANNGNFFNLSLQYLSLFVHRNYNFRFPAIEGLVSFNKDVTIQCPFTPFVSDFDEGLKKIKTQEESKLWDSINCSCDEIVKFKKNSNEFKNIISRIFVISSGRDDCSQSKVEDIVKKLISNKIIVDSVIFRDENASKMLCAICHATGGISFRFDDFYSCISLIEQSAFRIIEERKRYIDPIITGDRSTIQRELKPEMITSEFMEKAKNCAVYDTCLLNNEILFARLSDRPLETPAHICSIDKKSIILSSRMKRLSYEVYLAALMCDEKQSTYDPNVKIFIFKTMMDRWKIFLKGPEETPYENKWWYIYVNFPRNYPYQPPVFRFISLPYHLNVSSEGIVLFNIRKNEYNPSMNIIDIINDIRKILIHPDEENPCKFDILNEFKNNHDEYERLARKSAEINAKNDYHDYIKSNVDDSVPDGLSPSFNKNDLF